jgi:hypothetical protein
MGSSRTSTTLGKKLAIGASLVTGLARTIVDAQRRREFAHRLLEFHQYERFLAALSSPPRAPSTKAPDLVPFPLLVTTNQGLYLLDRGAWRCLLPVVCFGVARHDDRLFLGASAGVHSFILAAKIVGADSIDELRDLRVLARYETRYHNERVHQIAFDPAANAVHCANSRRNSLLAVDAAGDGVLDEKHLFADCAGGTITADLNHVNSVTMNGGILLFTAHSTGEGGALGFVADDKVRAYGFPARGIHDVLIHDGGIMFTDSFRDAAAAERPQAHGAIQYRGGEYLSQALETVGGPKLVLRGLALKERVLAVGVSAYAPRNERFTETGGGLAVFRDGALCGLVEGPFAQTYDILPADGRRTDVTGPVRSVTELDALFRRDVGPLLYEGPVLRSKRPLN